MTAANAGRHGIIIALSMLESLITESRISRRDGRVATIRERGVGGMKRRLMPLVIGLTALVVTGGPALAESGSSDHPPSDIIKRYVLLDQKGARLDAMSFDTLVPYIDWREEPAWGRVVVIREATVPEDYRTWEIINKLEVVIPVVFRVLGSVYLETAAFVADDTTEEVRFHVKVSNGKWKIMEPVIPPHVGLKRMLNFVREAQQHESDATKRSALAALEESLRKAK